MRIQGFQVSVLLFAQPPTEEVGRDGETRAVFCGRASALSKPY